MRVDELLDCAAAGVSRGVGLLSRRDCRAAMAQSCGGAGKAQQRQGPGRRFRDRNRAALYIQRAGGALEQIVRLVKNEDVELAITPIIERKAKWGTQGGGCNGDIWLDQHQVTEA